MLDLNDSSQLALSDSKGWLARAADAATRWPAAQAAGAKCAVAAPPAPARGIVWLVLPPALRGIAMALQSLSASAFQPLVLCWQPALLQLPGDAVWLDPYHILSETAIPAAPVRPPDVPAIDDHPSSHLLFWLSYLDQWLGRSLSTAATRVQPDQLQALANSAPSIPIGENPAKQMAHALHERLPIFWSPPALSGVAYDWWQRYTRYAESKAEWMEASAVRHITAAARFPRYWPQAGIYVYLAHEENASPPPALATLFQRRRLASLTFAAAAPDLASAMLYLFEAGEWIALYAAALLGVEPSSRVALDFLDSLSGGSEIA